MILFGLLAFIGVLATMTTEPTIITSSTSKQLSKYQDISLFCTRNWVRGTGTAKSSSSVDTRRKRMS